MIAFIAHLGAQVCRRPPSPSDLQARSVSQLAYTRLHCCLGLGLAAAGGAVSPRRPAKRTLLPRRTSSLLCPEPALGLLRPHRAARRLRDTGGFFRTLHPVSGGAWFGSVRRAASPHGWSAQSACGGRQSRADATTGPWLGLRWSRSILSPCGDRVRAALSCAVSGSDRCGV